MKRVKKVIVAHDKSKVSETKDMPDLEEWEKAIDEVVQKLKKEGNDSDEDKVC